MTPSVSVVIPVYNEGDSIVACLDGLCAAINLPFEILVVYDSLDDTTRPHVEEYARGKGYLELFERTGVEVIKPGCGACIGCGPGVSERGDQVTVSAINRNYKGRSGPGRLYLASPLTVAASAVAGEIVEYREGMFRAGDEK